VAESRGREIAADEPKHPLAEIYGIHFFCISGRIDNLFGCCRATELKITPSGVDTRRDTYTTGRKFSGP
jgi:hypothetical protein